MIWAKNILGKNNILSTKDFVINISKNCAFIENCKVTIFITTRQQGQFLGEKLLASNNNIVPSYSNMMILLVLVSPPNNHNFMFHPINQAKLILYTYIFNHITSKFLFSHIFDCLLLISRYQKLGHIIDIYFENSFLANAQTIFNFVALSPKPQIFFDLHTEIGRVPTNVSIKIHFCKIITLIAL